VNAFPREIVVGVDGSEPSRRAVDQAVRLGQRTGRTVHLVHAWEAPLPVGPAGADLAYDSAVQRDAARQDALELLENETGGALDRRRSGAPVTLRSTAQEGRIGPVLTEACLDAYLLAVGTKGHGRLGNLFLSWLADVLHHAPCPVLVVPAGVADAMPYARVVVGLDESPSSAAALQWAHELAECDGASLSAVHVVPPHSLPVDLRTLIAWREHVSAALPDVEAEECDVRLARGRPERALAYYVGSRDLLVIGSRGAGPLVGVLLGSVSAACVVRPRSPVLVVHAHEDPNTMVVASAAASGAGNENVG
jgi:nucleotide-binding universal stress UspA family protein